MDYEARKSLCALVEEATTTGEKELQAKHITLLKKFLRQGKDVVECAFDVALKQLRTGHSQVRLLAWYLVVYMFTRSQTVRELVETHIQEVMRLVIGDKKHSLPLPLDFAVLLQASAVEELKKWITAYPSMRRLATAEQYIQAHTHLMYTRQGNRSPASPATPTRTTNPSSNPTTPTRTTTNLHSSPNTSPNPSPNMKNKETTEGERKKIEKKVDEILEVMASMKNGLDLLFPDFEDLIFAEGEEASEEANGEGESEENEGGNECDEEFEGVQWEGGEEEKKNTQNDEEEFCDVQWEEGEKSERSEGSEEKEEKKEEKTIEDMNVILDGALGSSEYALDVCIKRQDKLEETEDNKDICDNLRAAYKQAKNRFLPYLETTLNFLRESGGPIELISQIGITLGELKQITERVSSLGIVIDSAPSTPKKDNTNTTNLTNTTNAPPPAQVTPKKEMSSVPRTPPTPKRPVSAPASLKRKREEPNRRRSLLVDINAESKAEVVGKKLVQTERKARLSLGSPFRNNNNLMNRKRPKR